MSIKTQKDEQGRTTYALDGRDSAVQMLTAAQCALEAIAMSGPNTSLILSTPLRQVLKISLERTREEIIAELAKNDDDTFQRIVERRQALERTKTTRKRKPTPPAPSSSETT